MSEHLDKAKAAIGRAGEIKIKAEQEKEPAPKSFSDLLRIATVQAAIAQADALERIADVLEEPFQS